MKKAFAGGFVLLGIVVFGFIFLLRSCLAKYDERSSISKTLVFEKEGKPYVFSLVQFDKTISYRSGGGFTRKTVSTSYYVQLNDAVTGKKLKEKKLKKQKEIKSFPVEIMGIINGIAVLYAGELMLINPFSLETIANTTILEAKNTGLKGKLPKERKYYFLDPEARVLSITATDGIQYAIDPVQLQASVLDRKNKDLTELNKGALKKELAILVKKIKDNYDIFREKHKDFREQRISGAMYQSEIAALERLNKTLGKMKDSLQILISETEAITYEKSTRKQMKASLQNLSLSYGSMLVNSDTLDKQWFGLYKEEEIEKAGPDFEPSSNSDAAARNYLYTANGNLSNHSNPNKFILEEEKKRVGEGIYISGGFLLDKETGIPFHLQQPNGFIIVHKDQIGEAGKILISRIGTNGQQLWIVRTGLKSFTDWIFSNGYLIVKGNNNKELSSSAANILTTVHLQTGAVVAYDFFKDKMVKN